jgi:nicotinamidase-related amidase
LVAALSSIPEFGRTAQRVAVVMAPQLGHHHPYRAPEKPPLMLIEAARSHLLVVDLQERLLPAIPASPQAVPRSLVLIAAAEQFGVPVSVTEQYPKGIGPSVAAIREALPASATIHEKISFAASGNEAFAAHVNAARASGRDQLVICGTEAHVCVLQTALGFRRLGYEVFVVGDAVGSRNPDSVFFARDRLIQAGCGWVNAEMVVFEWMERAGTDLFRSVVKLIK